MPSVASVEAATEMPTPRDFGLGSPEAAGRICGMSGGQESTADLLYGHLFAVNLKEGLAFRVSADKGVFMLLGA